MGNTFLLQDLCYEYRLHIYCERNNISNCNFFFRFLDRSESNFKRYLYKTALFINALQNYLVVLVGSTYVAYKVTTVPEPGSKMGKQNLHGAKSVVDLILLITNNGFRYFIAEFFLSKMFDEDLDILEGKTIEESIGVRVQRGRDNHHALDGIGT